MCEFISTFNIVGDSGLLLEMYLFTSASYTSRRRWSNLRSSIDNEEGADHSSAITLLISGLSGCGFLLLCAQHFVIEGNISQQAVVFHHAGDATQRPFKNRNGTT